MLPIFNMGSSLANYLISLLLFSSNLFFPQIGFVVTIFVPIFLIKFFLDENRKQIDNIVFLLGVLGILIFLPYFGIYYMIISVLPAYFIYMYHNKKLSEKIDLILLSSFPILIFTLVILFFLTDYKTAISDYLTLYLETVIKNYESVTNPGEYNTYLLYIKNNLKKIVFVVIHLMPALSFVYVSFISTVAKRYYLKRYRLREPRYKVNDKLIIPFLVGGFLILSNNLYLRIASYNTLTIFGILFFYQGADIVNFYMNKFRMRAFLRFIIYFLIFSEPYVIVVVAVAGLIDNWFDLTKVTFKRKNSL